MKDVEGLDISVIYYDIKYKSRPRIHQWDKIKMIRFIKLINCHGIDLDHCRLLEISKTVMISSIHGPQCNKILIQVLDNLFVRTDKLVLVNFMWIDTIIRHYYPWRSVRSQKAQGDIIKDRVHRSVKLTEVDINIQKYIVQCGHSPEFPQEIR